MTPRHMTGRAGQQRQRHMPQDLADGHDGQQEGRSGDAHGHQLDLGGGKEQTALILRLVDVGRLLCDEGRAAVRGGSERSRHEGSVLRKNLHPGLSRAPPASATRGDVMTGMPARASGPRYFSTKDCSARERGAVAASLPERCKSRSAKYSAGVFTIVSAPPRPCRRTRTRRGTWDRCQK